MCQVTFDKRAREKEKYCFDWSCQFWQSFIWHHCKTFSIISVCISHNKVHLVRAWEFWNYFLWRAKMITWKDLLLLLTETQSVTFAGPKNHNTKNVSLNSDTLIFATRESKIIYVNLYATCEKRKWTAESQT